MTKDKPTAGIVGTHVSGSLSPAIHNAAYQEMGVDLTYERFQVPEMDDLPVTRKEFLKRFLNNQYENGVVGMSVTMPLKLDLLGCDRVSPGSPTTMQIGSANTLSHPDNGIWFPDCTDWMGAMAALEEAGAEIDGSTGLVLGSGGTAKAVAFGMAERGAKTVMMAARNRKAVETMADEICIHFPDTAFQTVTIDEGYVPYFAVNESNIVFNATSAGQDGTDGEGLSPLDYDTIRQLKAGTVVCDAVYIPIQTPFLTMAGQVDGVTVVDGTRMLLHQAVPQVEAFTGISDVPIEVMDKALREAITNRPIPIIQL